jgi:hypothetical protein
MDELRVRGLRAENGECRIDVFVGGRQYPIATRVGEDLGPALDILERASGVRVSDALARALVASGDVMEPVTITLSAEFVGSLFNG